MTCDIRFLVSGYGNPSETSISLIRADLSAGSFSVEQKFTGLHAPSYLSVHKTDQGTFLYTFEKSGREGKVLAFLLDEKGLHIPAFRQGVRQAAEPSLHADFC